MEEEEEEEGEGVGGVGVAVGASLVAEDLPTLLLQGEATPVGLIPTPPDRQPPPRNPSQYSHPLEKVKKPFLF